MLIRKRQFAGPVLLTALIAIGGSSQPVHAQRRAIGRALLSAAATNRQPSLLDQIFSRNRSCSSGRCISRSTSNFYYSSNGTPYDGFAEASRIDRYLQPGIPTNSSNGFASSNVANVYAPANYRLSPTPGVSPGGLGAAPLSMQVSNLSPLQTNAIGIPATYTMKQPQPPNLGQALWQARSTRMAAPPSPAVGTSIPIPPATTQQPIRQRTNPRFANLALRNGARAFRDGDYARSVADYREAIRMGCGDSRAQLGLAIAELAAGRLDEAAEAVKNDLGASPQLDRSLLDVRMAYSQPEAFDVHMTRLNEAIAASPDNADLVLLAGFMRYYSGEKNTGSLLLRKYADSPEANVKVAAFIDRALSGR